MMRTNIKWPRLILFPSLCVLLALFLCAQSWTPALDHPLLRGAVSWWVAAPGFTGGDRLMDLLPARNHLTLTNMGLGSASGWSPTTRRGGYAQVNCDGSDDSLTITVNSSMNLTAGTIMAWAYRATQASQAAIVSFGDGAVCCSSFLYLTFDNLSDAIKVYEVSGGADKILATTTSSTLAPAGVWHQIVWAVDGAGNTLYVDGQAAALTYTAGTSATTNFLSTIYGSLATMDACVLNTSDDHKRLTGAVDNLMLFNRALSAAEVQEWYRLSQVDPLQVAQVQNPLGWVFPTSTLLPFFN